MYFAKFLRNIKDTEVEPSSCDAQVFYNTNGSIVYEVVSSPSNFEISSDSGIVQLLIAGCDYFSSVITLVYAGTVQTTRGDEQQLKTYSND